MPLTLECPLRARERILTLGVQGTGKSYAPLTIARMCPGSQFHILDTDYSDSYEVGLDTEFSDLNNVEIHKVGYDDWCLCGPVCKGCDGFKGTAERLASLIGPDDWLVVDTASCSWDSVQAWFIQETFGKDSAEYFMEVRKRKEGQKDDGKGKKSLGALEGWMDWPVINKNYSPIYSTITRIQGHLYVTAEQAQLSDDDDREVKKLFGPYGVKPRGQKRLGHVPRTVLLFTKSRAGEYSMTTIKDRHRVEQEDIEFENFAMDYLVKVAGWKKKLVKGNVA